VKQYTVTLTYRQIVGLLEMRRVLGKDLGSVHPSIRPEAVEASEILEEHIREERERLEREFDLLVG
jgi:hypothetical protein